VIAEGPPNAVLADPSVMSAFLGETDLAETGNGTVLR
jgi:hypothetical protein